MMSADVEFEERVKVMATRINDAWVARNMDPVRCFLSGGMHNRLRVLLKMMRSENRWNVVSNYEVVSVEILKSARSGPYEILPTRLTFVRYNLTVPANATEEEVQKALTGQSPGRRSEYWTFVRRAGATGEPFIMLDQKCPSCGAVVEKGEIVKCQHCGVLVNSGEYDWVLSEITQTSVWKPIADWKSNEFAELGSDFSPCIVEDRCSFLFWLWIEAQNAGDPDLLKRFCTETFLKNGVSKTDYKIVAVGSVDIIESEIREDVQIVRCSVEWSYVRRENRTNIFVLQRTSNSISHRALSGISCAQCGGPFPESDSANCSYCRKPYPVLDEDWLLDQVV